MSRRLAAALLTAALVTPACGDVGGTGSPDRIDVVVGLYPLAMVAERVGGDRVNVTDLAPPGAEPHDLELTPSQVADVERADVVLYIRGLQPALDAAVSGDGLDALAEVDGEDPHIWLDPLLLGKVAEALAEKLVGIDESGTATYRNNAAKLATELTAVHDETVSALTGCARKDLVTSHAAFGRFATRFGLRQTGITGVDPEAEPSPRRIADVVAFAKKNGVTTVFAETGDDKTAQTVAREVGAKVGVLDPIEVDRGTGYVEVMRSNVTALRAALGCP